MNNLLWLALLKDHSASKDDEQHNIFWATHDYETLGDGYGYFCEISPELIGSDNSRMVLPRVMKQRDMQTARSKEMAEVFTPSWLCNAQNNLIDNEWFGREGAFNTEHDDHTWTASPSPVEFPEGKQWTDYVRENRMEITCGEAPYLASRYDATTGEPIPTAQRIGLLDRKLRVVSENCDDVASWTRAAKVALMSCYGYEWQGDSLMLARENLLITLADYYEAKFGRAPTQSLLESAAYIISWNLFQMDGLKGVVPDSCERRTTTDLFGNPQPCPACKRGSMFGHVGIPCLLREWKKDFSRPGKGKVIKFTDLLNPKNK